MIVNGPTLLAARPIMDMTPDKRRAHGVSYGLTEAGYDIRIAQDVIMGGSYPRFTLASAMEEFAMPPGLCGVVHDKSTWARQGLSVFNTVVEPGWHGYLTLELVYHGDAPLRIPAGSGIAQVLFSSVVHPAYYDGKYQHQEAGPQEARWSE